VIALDPQRIAELYSLRTVLEEFAVRQAFPHLTAADIERLTGFVAIMRAAADRDDLAETVRTHLQFHDEFYRLARHEVLYNMWRSVSLQSQLSINASFVTKGLHQAVDSHDEILRALHERNLEALAAAMRNHIAEAGAQLTQLLAHDAQA
jgi:DNA-binding GntR family transcriptional regulator